MKSKGLKNRFSKDVRNLWMFWYRCMWCGENQFDALHHIISPSSHGWKAGTHNTSAINSSPLHNIGCHIDNGLLHKREYEIKLLNKTIAYLDSIEYTYTDKDKEFFEKYYDTHFKEIYSNGDRPWA